MVYGHVVTLLLLLKYRTQANGVIHGEKWTSVGRDGMIEMVSLNSVYAYVLLSYCS